MYYRSVLPEVLYIISFREAVLPPPRVAVAGVISARYSPLCRYWLPGILLRIHPQRSHIVPLVGVTLFAAALWTAVPPFP
jgi:hypothetical protein